jgi:hypothetical protein
MAITSGAYDRTSSISPVKVAILLAATLGSVGGVLIRALGYPEGVPQVLTRLLTSFIEPGLAVWWFTLGGAFQSFPSSAPGYAVTIAANVAFWLLLAFLASGVARYLRRRVGPRK